MRHLRLPLRLAAPFLLVACAFNAGHAQTSPPSPARQLRLDAGIVSQERCANGSLKMALTLRYSNTGSEPIILFKYSGSITNYYVSKNVRDAAAGNNEQTVRASIFPTKLDLPVGGAEPDKDFFVVLQPGDTYETRTDTYVDTTDNDSKPLRAGEHVLQVKVLTWYWHRDSTLLDDLRRRWKDIGYLWTRAVTSSPTAFRIEGDAK